MLMFVIANVSFSILEILILQLGAIILGIAIHFFLTSRRNVKSPVAKDKNMINQLEELRLRYVSDIKRKDNELADIHQKLSAIEENNEILTIELEEKKNDIKDLKAQHESEANVVPHGERPDFIEHLSMAQNNLQEHNVKVSKLLEQISVIREMEERQLAVLKENEALTNQIENLNYTLKEKETEINNTRKKAALTNEMAAMLDNAYGEFNLLQAKMQKLESQVAESRMVSIEYEDLKEAHYRMSHDFDENKTRLQALSLRDHELTTHLHAVEDSLNDANFQRLQLQKRVNYLEELNTDLQGLGDSNKKLEGQLRKIGELESKLNMVEEERDQLLSRRGA